MKTYQEYADTVGLRKKEPTNWAYEAMQDKTSPVYQSPEKEALATKEMGDIGKEALITLLTGGATAGAVKLGGIGMTAFKKLFPALNGLRQTPLATDLLSYMRKLDIQDINNMTNELIKGRSKLNGTMRSGMNNSKEAANEIYQNMLKYMGKEF